MTAEAGRGAAGSWGRAALVGAAVVALLVVARLVDGPGLLRQALEATRGLGPLGAALFVGLYVVATVLLLPGAILTLGAGAVFGVVWGALLVSLAATLGATAAFLVGRHLAREWVAARVAGYPAFRAIDEAVGRQGWKIVGLARLSPVVPFNVLNYALGVTRIRLRDYVLASWIGMMPGTLMYVYLGALAADLATLGSGPAGGRAGTPAEWGLFLVGLLATVAVTVYVTRLARSALGRRLGEPRGPEAVADPR
jgi:uncharacterized membrane protein YdjX (TVP38/TMEM64 family)